MADQDFDIKIRTTADTAGVREAEAALGRLKASGVSSSVAEQLAGAGAGFDPRTGKFASITSDVAANGEKIATSMEEAGGASLFFGANLTRARQESIILARELATGVPTTRTLSSLMGSLGIGIAAAGLAGFGLYKAITAYGDRQLQINRDLDEQLTKLTASAEKWKEIAQTATSFEDVQKVAGSVLPALDAAQAKFREFQNAGTSWWKDMLDSLLKIPGITGGPFEKLFQDQANRLGENTERVREQAVAAIKLGKEYETAFEKRKTEPFAQAIDELTKKIEEQRALQEQVGAENVESYTAIGRIIEVYKKQLTDIIKLEDTRRKEALAAAKPLAKDIQTSDADFQKEQKKAAAEHRAERDALKIKQQEALAVGDTETANAIEDTLKKAKFTRDQEKERAQRRLALQKDIYSTPSGEVDQYSTRAGGVDRFETPESALRKIYQQERAEKPEGISDPALKDILTELRKMNDLWR